MSTNNILGKVEINGELSELSKLLTKGISDELENRIRKDLEAHVAPLIEGIAKDIARSITLSLKAYTMQHSPYGEPKISVVLNIDKQQVEFQDK